MNQVFAEATTGVAFVLTLTKRQCNTLLRLRQIAAEAEKRGLPAWQNGGHFIDGNDSPMARFYSEVIVSNPMPSLHALKDRGLVFWHYDENGRGCGFGGLTRAGELAADLLLEAGLSIDATNTLSVLKRLDRAA